MMRNVLREALGADERVRRHIEQVEGEGAGGVSGGAKHVRRV